MIYDNVKWRHMGDCESPDQTVHAHVQSNQGLHCPLSLDVKQSITKTYLYNFEPHFYIVKLGFTGVYIIFVISAQKHRLWVLVRTASTRRF